MFRKHKKKRFAIGNVTVSTKSYKKAKLTPSQAARIIEALVKKDRVKVDSCGASRLRPIF